MYHAWVTITIAVVPVRSEDRRMNGNNILILDYNEIIR